MKILYLANVRLPTEKAHGLQIMKTCEALADAGAEVVLCIPRRRRNPLAGDPFSHYGVKRNFTIRKIPSLDLIGMKPAKLGFALTQLSFAIGAAFMRMDASDVVYARDEYSLYPLTFYKSRLYFEAHDGRWNAFMSRVARKATGIVSITSGLADFFTKKGIPPAKISVVPDGVDIEQFRIGASAYELRRELGLPTDAKIAMYSGSLSVYSWKGADVFLESFAYIDDASVRFCIVGGSEKDIEALKSRYSDPRIIYVGRVAPATVPKYLAAADAFILPNKSGDPISERFTSPMKLFEYMAAGKPIIASDLPSMREVLDDSNSILVAPNDPRALSTGIATAMNDAALRTRIVARASEDIEKYSWQARARKIIAAVGGSGGTRKDTAFYDRESAKYSEKRYPLKSTEYTHAFFKRRLAIVEREIEKTLRSRPGSKPSLLEVGCADGIVLRKLYERFGDRIGSYRGIDISPGMIESARAKSAGMPISYAVRDPKECFGGTADIIIEVGVLNYADFDKDMGCASDALRQGGAYICSVAGKGSFWDKNRTSDTGFANFRTYGEYETKMRERFEIVSTRPVGLHVRGIWKLPWIARAIQLVAELGFACIIPGTFHEKAYVLMK